MRGVLISEARETSEASLKNQLKFSVMGSFQNSKGRFTELLFENRNKNYGAYAISKTYDKRIIFSMAMTLGIFTLAVFGSSLVDKKEDPVYSKPNTKVTIITDIHLPDKKDPIQPKVKPPVARPPKGNVSSVIQAVDTNKLVEQDTTKHQFVLGDPHGDTGKVKDPIIAMGGGHDSIPMIQQPEKPLDIADVNPEFPVVFKALYEFLRKNIKSPEIALENKIGGPVYLSFVVGSDGTVKDISSLTAPPQSLANEAIRVAGLMPKWKPGRMGDHPVAVKFGIPVKFTTAEK